MNKDSSRSLAILLMVLSIIGALIFTFKIDFLIPAGYELAIDGIVISRTLMIIFSFYLFMKLGIFLYESTKKED